ncbi:1,4-alpha-glucan branching protein GlgB [Gordonia sp. VNK21]|uniref:1,4-alpha-glucan branching protein GlgB n=1 Tax=Gordonia sp. VNK21 TaxID=3382483 RepID=UPI0038D3CEE5
MTARQPGTRRPAGPLWQRLGAHPDGDGTAFGVWAPNARAVSVVGALGDEGWAEYPMTPGGDGDWRVRIPGARPGQHYRFRVTGADGRIRDKADPLARAAACPPETASVIAGPSSYVWTDQEWLARRAGGAAEAGPLSIYEVHLPSWRPGLGYRELARLLADHVGALGFTHVQLLPITEHPYGGSWGYQVSSYFAPTARLGAPEDFRYFVDVLHGAGIGVLLDWVPAHFPKDEFALARFDGTPLYEHADPLRREQPDWGTYAFNLGRPEVAEFLLASAEYWCTEFHLDGLRVDAVAAMLYLDYSRDTGQWRPNDRGTNENDEAVAFLRELNHRLHQRCPGVLTVAEESTAWPGVTAAVEHGGLGFDFKWDLGWMNNLLSVLALPHERRGLEQQRLIASLGYAGSERFVLPLSHDEVVHGKGTLLTRLPGPDRAAGVRGLLAYQWAHPGKKLLFAGQEFGQRAEWDDVAGPDWELLADPGHRGIADLVTDLNRLHRRLPALHAGDGSAEGFEWLDAQDVTNAVLGFLRRSAPGATAPGELVAVLVNFSGRDLYDYRIGFPLPGRWTEILNTAALDYAGSGVGNLGSVHTVDVPSHGRPCSATVTLPAQSVVYLTPAAAG